MLNKNYIIGVWLLLTLGCKLQAFDKIIYGQDDRILISLMPAQSWQYWSQSVAGVLPAGMYKEDPASAEHITLIENPRLALRLCPEERFANELSVFTCTAFLVKPDVVATAGHCLNGQIPWQKMSFLFGAQMGMGHSYLKNDLYFAKNLMAYVYRPKDNIDYALIQLDRQVQGRLPLAISRTSSLKINSPLIMIGHGLGLKATASVNARLSNFGENSFQSNLDSFTGHSGAPVFNQQTGMVEGLHILGQEGLEFDSSRGCAVTKRCQRRCLKARAMRAWNLPL